MTPALARIKLGIRKAIGWCGGIDGAGATASRSRTVAGSWNNLNESAFPTLDAALALDEIAVSQGHLPPITCALAVELGGVFVPNIDVAAEEGTPAYLVMQLSHDLGQVAGEIAHALADDARIDAREAARTLAKMEAHDRTAAQLRMQLERIAKGE